ncbi:MAG TPA: UDP-2,3-diacylglucosamine diphosphatase LpxI [Deltaproteobacteria bacterium]|nr:UDP-2,3-diacylglucosamine diphosphatase LpxI [Deltaproteobacteria bacterium]HIJ41505.1 UDP-2,3-diacylglucosamine diphosphatase LpxI [Deltaproteobacteria bacterium]
MVAEAAKARGLRTVAVALYGETEPVLSEKVDKIIWIKLGQLGHLIKAFRAEGVKNAIMAGSIAKKRMFENLRPDLKGLAIMTKLAVFHDDDILRAVADELAGEGIEIVSSTAYLPELLVEEGCFTKRKPGKEEMEDILFGWKVAKELGRLDIGQSVVVRQKTVLAVEAIDGTDATIRRGGRIAKEKAVVVKVSKPNQDLRFDVPSIGLETIEIMGEVKAAALAVEAGRTLIFDREKMLQKANEKKIAVIALSAESIK